ncbi:hypothetical protein HYPSUDRAFT_84421 [Hypholoma sublateritium FD-334 SS-4]|uniref:DUF8191 domain-containing protein n=1 Tax=Hypholoma sublateritium (strain FD-334 SS-4) TaxID=945553 RepID=A0A0D2P6F2_HYPSF|nr:hypothetical protein HYPSUDRAFT_84421 [Hypholoma sublateritium FD-334 SS-4]
MAKPDLLATVKFQKSELKRKDSQIRTLKRALHLMGKQKRGDSIISSGGESDAPQSALSTTMDESDGTESETESNDGPPDPIFDGDLLYCSECTFELEVDPEEGVCMCERCDIEHNWETFKDDFQPDSCYLDNQAMCIHRNRVPRGDTPVDDQDEIFSYMELPFNLPIEYRPRACRKDEYLELLKRGATQLMCEEFHLEFSDDEGIYAWADEGIFAEFACPQMQVGDFWKIHLGRRIYLDEDDLDGSKFIEGILEDGLLFPLFEDSRKSDNGKWETREESPGIWLTRLKTEQESFSGSSASKLPKGGWEYAQYDDAQYDAAKYDAEYDAKCKNEGDADAEDDDEDEDDEDDEDEDNEDADGDDDEDAEAESESLKTDDTAEQRPNSPERICLKNKYESDKSDCDQSEDESEEEQSEDNSDDSDTEMEHYTCECPVRNTCHVCTERPYASWSDDNEDDSEGMDCDELEDEDDDDTSLSSVDSDMLDIK